MKVTASGQKFRTSWWRRWFVKPVLDQLTRGATPEKLGWTVGLGVALGVFPIMGTTTVVSLVVGWALGLNQPVLQAVKSLVYPLQLALILVFIRLGQRLFGSPLIAFSIPELLARFKQSPVQFARDFGLAAGQGLVAWLLISPAVVVLVKLAVTPLLRKLAESRRRRADMTA